MTSQEPGNNNNWFSSNSEAVTRAITLTQRSTVSPGGSGDRIGSGRPKRTSFTQQVDRLVFWSVEPKSKSIRRLALHKSPIQRRVHAKQRQREALHGICWVYRNALSPGSERHVRQLYTFQQMPKSGSDKETQVKNKSSNQESLLRLRLTDKNPGSLESTKTRLSCVHFHIKVCFEHSWAPFGMKCMKHHNPALSHS